ncbi:MAG: PH domain-containing protein [Oscillospiraceae bacterium]|nr:PH domain-containing protein [Oscillospiraceae bacterium]
MKKFDKGYIYSCLLSDLFSSLVVVFIFLKDFFLDESAKVEDIIAAIPFFVIGFAVVYLCFIVYRILYYKTSGYELTEKEIKCNRGVLFRKRSVLDYKKVHAINKKQNIFHRIFGIAILTVDSGSTNTSHQAEITIIEKDKIVDDLLNELNALKEGGARNVESTQPKDELLLSDEDSLYCFTSGKKMLYTLINIASTAFFTALFAVLAIIVIGICKLMLQQNFLGTWGQYFLFAFLITLGAMLLFSMFSLIGCLIHSFVGYYQFKITKRGNDIQISYGLLEKHTNTFSYDKIKAVKITQGLVQRMLGFASIRLEVIGYTVNSGDDDKNAGLGALVPFCKYDEIGEILSKVLPDYVPDKKQTKSISYFSFISWFALTLGIITGVVLLQAALPMLIFNVPSTIIVAVAFAVVGVGAIIIAVKALSAALSYQNNGIAINDGKITAYYGGFTKNVTVFMARNLIAAENVTTPLRQKAGITSLVMHLKTNALSNEVKVHIQNDALSEEVEKLLIL